MNASDDSSSRGATRTTRGRLWFGIVVAFIAASGVQILFYGAPRLLGFRTYNVPDPWYTPTVLAFLFLPALLAAAFSLRRIGVVSRRPHTPRSGAQVAVVLVLAVVSAYLGVFVAFNVWGT